MGSCLSVEEGHQLSSRNKSSGVCGDSGLAKGGSESLNSIVIIPKNVKDLRQSPGNGDLDIFTYEEMKLATKHFRPDQVLGEGGFGIVYKGVINDNVRVGYKATQVAIKELDPESVQGDREWLAEVNYLGQLRHPNLVKLIGYCCEGDHRLLVYEYMASGSLEKHLFLRVRATLTWHKRLKIALDAAKGLAFLHGVEKPIIYRDFKTSNILVDGDFNAKLSDFGLARVGPTGDQTHVSTRVMGTYGYAAPEYVMTGHLTARSDVYGFGVVLLEMLIGRRAMDKSRPSREHNLVEWARPLLNHGKKLVRILDPRIEGQYSSKILMKVANLAYQCLSQNPKGRPLMNQVIEILEPLVAQEVSQEDMTLQNGGGSVTLYEVPKTPSKETRPVEREAEGVTRASSSAVELQRKNDDLRTTTADLDSASFSDENYDQKSASEQEIESTSYGEIQVVSEMTTSTGTKNFGVWKRDIEFTSSNAEKSMHHQATGFIASEFVLEEKHYSVSMKDDHIKLKLDHQIILIEECRPSKPPEGSNVEPVLNLVERDFRELPEKSDYHNALFLFLQRNYRLSLIHSSFFDSMPELRFLDLSDTRIRILPSSLFRLSKLNVLMLRNCVSLENLPSEIRELNQIEVLDLAGTELYNLPNEIVQLTLLKHMQLSFYGPDDESEYDHLPSQLVSPSILSELKELRALSITVHPDDNRWKTDASCIMKDVGKLEMLTYLQLYFPELEMFELFIQTSPSWEKHKLSNFNFIVGHNVKRIASRVPDEVESLFDQQDKCFRFVNGDRVTQVIKTVLIQVTALYLDHHIGIQSLSEFGITNFRVLKFCVLRECPRIQAIVDEKRVEDTFPCLEHLSVYYLWDLKHIWKPSSGPGRFNTSLACLKHLTVNTCPKLQFVLWESMLQSISNLEELVVEDCESVEKIIKEENKKVKHDDVMLPRLRKLELHYLPELVSLGNGLSLPEEIIRVYGCPKLVLKSSKFPVS